MGGHIHIIDMQPLWTDAEHGSRIRKFLLEVFALKLDLYEVELELKKLHIWYDHPGFKFIKGDEVVEGTVTKAVRPTPDDGVYKDSFGHFVMKGTAFNNFFTGFVTELCGRLGKEGRPPVEERVKVWKSFNWERFTEREWLKNCGPSQNDESQSDQTKPNEDQEPSITYMLAMLEGLKRSRPY